MPEALGDPPSPRTALFWNGTAWQWARVDAAGHLQIDVLTIAAGVDVATAANQAIMITALQLIDNLVVALGGPGNVRLQVRGEDQLFTYRENLHRYTPAVISGADGYIQSPTVGAGTIWVVTNLVMVDLTTPTTLHEGHLREGATNFTFHTQAQAFALGDRSEWHGHVYADAGSRIRVFFTGGLAGDDCELHLTGYIMTLEV